jgi:hypothetical protein
MQIDHKPIHTIFRDARKIAEKQNKQLLNTNQLTQAVKDKELVRIMTKEMDDEWFISGTSITYEKNSEWATIKSHKGNAVRLRVPEYRRTPLSEVMKTKDGKHYLKTLFGTKKVKQLLDNYNKDLSKVVWTRCIEDREDNQERAVRLYFNEDRFDIDGICFGNNGFSHSVSIESAKQSNGNPKKYSKEEIRNEIDNDNPDKALAMMEFNKLKR